MSIELRVQHRLGPGFTLDVDVQTSAQRVALYGPSGAGKSSLLLAIAGLLTPRAGRIRIGEQLMFDSASGANLAPHQRRVGYVPQQSWLLPLKTVRQNLVFGRPPQPSLELEEVVDALGIEALLDRRPARLSGGERQRVALGRAVLSEPSVLLCDEPFSALDRARRDALLSTLEHWRARMNIPLVLVTHQREEVRAMADHVVVLAGGRITSQGPLVELDAAL